MSASRVPKNTSDPNGSATPAGTPSVVRIPTIAFDSPDVTATTVSRASSPITMMASFDAINFCNVVGINNSWVPVIAKRGIEALVFQKHAFLENDLTNYYI
jgi:hypothetical protein